MTKRREPGGFGHAVTVIAARIGWDVAAEIVGKSDRAVRNWSEDDKDALPDLQEAFELDAAYLKDGGGEPPLLAAYARMLDRVAPKPAEEAERIEAVARAAREAGEFTATAIRAVGPSADHKDITEAEREGHEAIAAISDAVHRLRPRKIS